MEILAPTRENIRRAADALRAGEVVAYPTETVYGLGVDPFNESALKRLYDVKKRDERNPVLLIVSSMEQLAPLIGALSERARSYADAFWPGPLSLVLLATKEVPRTLIGQGGKICVRWTSNPIAAALCEAFGGAIVSTSANLSAQPPARFAREVPAHGVAVCIDGGELSSAAASTVLDPETGTILRNGAISAAAIAALHYSHDKERTMSSMRIAVGSDHAGYEGNTHFKPEIMAHLGVKGYDVINCGTDSGDAVDYPDVAERVCAKILDGAAERGVLVCGTGTGMSITANRHKGIRAAVCTSVEMAKLSREHNHTNVLCLGRRLLDIDECKKIIDAWLAEPESKIERHQRRVDKMDRVGSEL
jgi:ribose 5-phosphate isomerase B/tRNA threonylcarbamoyl adenosine modification protein (Sua5/YciO/YrdC/YwlC family)